MDSSALLNQGFSLYNQGEITQAIEIWRSIKQDKSPEIYAMAQFNLGLALAQQGEVSEAIAAWRNVEKDDSAEDYAKAQLNLGIILAQQGDTQGAINALSSVRRTSSPQLYAHAQLRLGMISEEQDNIKEAIEAYNRVKYQDCPPTYSFAQYILGNALLQQDEIQNAKYAIKAYNNVKKEEAPVSYAKAQFNLKVALGQKDNIPEAIEIFELVKTYNYYDAEPYLKILKCPKDYQGNLRNILYHTIKLLNTLQIKSNDNNHEKKVAHYTTATVAKLLIQGENKNSPSAFRLNSIKNVNDPAEGLVLGQYLQKHLGAQSALLNDMLHKDENTNVFISCFTFNHDSLNQFRLYGKENNKEASGVSLVFNSEFFNQTTEFGFIGQLPKPNEPYNPNEKPSTSETSTKTPSLQKQALYRCIYIDPESDYWRLAQRDEITFYREVQYQKANSTTDKNANTITAYENYQTYQNDKIKKDNVDTILKKLSIQSKRFLTAW